VLPFAVALTAAPAALTRPKLVSATVPTKVFAGIPVPVTSSPSCTCAISAELTLVIVGLPLDVVP
jgi:hypothetical protein